MKDLVKIALHKSKENGYSIADIFEDSIDIYANNIAFEYTGCTYYPKRSVTFKQFDNMANQVSNFFLEQKSGLKVVAIFMQNSIEYLVISFALAKIGIEIAFINNTIKGEPFLASLLSSGSEYLIYGTELESVLKDLDLNIPCKKVSAGLNEIKSTRATRPSRKYRQGVKFTDVYGYVFTSGTTGLPKAVRVTHLRQLNFARGFDKYGIDKTTVLYSSGMPLYHGSAHGIGTGMVMLFGCSQIISPKFSASSWLDIVLEYNVTAFQYIGEICRYILLHTKANSNVLEKLKSLNNSVGIKFATGNGLAKDIWYEFQTLFGIENILEFYGSTEGNGSFTNLVTLKDIRQGKLDGIGCIGRVSLSGKRRFRIVKYDVENEELILDSQGKLIDCAPNEAGECLFQVIPRSASTKFVGYTDSAATNKKVFTEKGIAYFRTGDLLTIDLSGWVRFSDRIGDTYRWKGENVSTSEVAAEVLRSVLVSEALIYGVKVPNVEGKAGCAGIVLSPLGKSLSLEEFGYRFLEGIRATLPKYAIPMFLRILEDTDVTGTMKLQKVKLKRQGINVANFEEKMLWLNPGANKYQIFNAQQLNDLHNGKLYKSRL